MHGRQICRTPHPPLFLTGAKFYNSKDVLLGGPFLECPFGRSLVEGPFGRSLRGRSLLECPFGGSSLEVPLEDPLTPFGRSLLEGPVGRSLREVDGPHSMEGTFWKVSCSRPPGHLGPWHRFAPSVPRLVRGELPAKRGASEFAFMG